MSDPSAPQPQQPTYPTYPANPGYAPMYAAPPTNTLAIVAFVLAFVVSLGAVICGHIALAQIKRTGEGGRGLALAAVIIGYAAIGISVILVVVYVIFIALVVAGVGASSHLSNG